MALLRRQPFKFLFVFLDILTTLTFRVPYWIISSIPRSKRPRPTWSVFRCVFVYGLRRYFLLSYATGGFLNSPDYRAIREGRDVHGIWVSPAQNLIVGSILEKATKAGIEYVKIPGYWFVKKGQKYEEGFKPREGEKVIYSLHGGGYCSFSAHPSDPLAHIRTGILAHSPKHITRLFSLEYRLSKLDFKKRRSTHPFPTALVDAIAGYNYLINHVGYKPENIILEGDSAGANLILALTRYIIEHQSQLPPTSNLAPPGGIIADSPWVDLSLSHIMPGSSALPAVPADILPTTKWGPGNSWYSVRAFLGMEKQDLLAAKSDPYISPASLDIIDIVTFSGPGNIEFPKTLIIIGDADGFLDSVRTFFKRMKDEMGDRVEMLEVKDAVHDFLALDLWEPGRTYALEKIGEWIAKL